MLADFIDPGYVTIVSFGAFTNGFVNACALRSIIDVVNVSYRIVSLCLFFMLFVIQGVLIIYSVNNNKILRFYKKLTKNRSKERKTEKRDDYVNSYKHLREHGNAFLILLMEFSLGFVLINAKTSNEIIALITLWILPGSIVWLIGTYLEFNLNNLHD